MIRRTPRQIAVIVSLIVIVPLAFSVPGLAGAPSEMTPPADIGGQPVEQAQSGTNTTPQPAGNATVTFADQTTNGSTVTVKRVTLSQPGFIALHTSSYADDLVGPNESIIAVSQRLSAGTHHNVSINVSHAPPGNAPGLNRSRLNETQTLVATVYGDTNDNKRLDSVRSFGENDTFVAKNGSVVRDSARVRVPSPPRQTASVVFKNQTLQNNTLTVAKARLPRGGFLIAHNASYRRTGDPLTSAVGISRYLPPGTHTNVTLSVIQGGVNDSQIVTVRPSLDTNNNKRYDFVKSGGFRDVAYETRNRSNTITDSALVRVPASSQSSSTQTTRTASSTPAPTVTPTATRSASTATSPGEPSGSNGLVNSLGLVEIVGILVVILGGILVVGNLRKR